VLEIGFGGADRLLRIAAIGIRKRGPQPVI